MPGHIGAYPTVDIDGGVTLRPTNEGCLMRDVTVPSKFSPTRNRSIEYLWNSLSAFCSVCLEGLTLSLLRRVSLVKSSEIRCPSSRAADTSSDNSATIAITLLNMTDATYALRWYRGTTEINTFANQTTIRVPGRAESTVAAWYTAEVELSLPQVRLEGREEMKENVKIWYQGCD